MIMVLIWVGILNMAFYEYRVKKDRAQNPKVFRFDGLKKL